MNHRKFIERAKQGRYSTYSNPMKRLPSLLSTLQRFQERVLEIKSLLNKHEKYFINNTAIKEALKQHEQTSIH
jgi:hypothetical protein